MKLVKSTFLLAATFAASAVVAQAEAAPALTTMPLNIALTAYVTPGSTIQAVSINNASILAKIGKALNANLSAAKLAVANDGSIVIVDGTGAILINLSKGTNTPNYNLSTNKGPNNAVLDYYSQGYAYIYTDYGNFDNGVVTFWDPIWVGSVNSNAAPVLAVAAVSPNGSSIVNVKGSALGGYIDINYGYRSYVHNATTGQTRELTSASEEIEVSDGSNASVACALAAGVYKQSFSLSASGYYYSSLFGSGRLFGTMSASGTQTGGPSFLDDFNGAGNFNTDLILF